MENLESVKRKIRALSAKTVDAGCSEAEAMAAMNKVAELLSTFNLSMSEVELQKEECIVKMYSTGKTRSPVYYVWSGIAKLCGVRVWRAQGYKAWNWYFFGVESDVEMALYLVELAERSGKTALAIFRTTDDWQNFHSHRRTLTANFQYAFGSRLNTRLRELAEKNKETERSSHQSTGTALISIAKERLIEEAFKKQVDLKLKTTKSYAKMRQNINAQNAGVNAANKVNLSRPVGNSSGKTTGYLK